MSGAVVASDEVKYEWTLDATGVEDVTVPEELVELVARTHGYVIHSSIAPNDETSLVKARPVRFMEENG